MKIKADVLMIAVGVIGALWIARQVQLIRREKGL